MRDEKREPLFLLSTESGGLAGDALRITLSLCYLNEQGELRNYVSSGSLDEDPYADLRISALADRDATMGDTYGWSTEYRDVFAVDLRRAEAMVKVLRRLTRELEKLNGELGYAESFGAYCARVAKVLGVKKFGWKTDGRSSTYADNEYRFGDAPQLAYRLASVLAEYRQPAGAAH